MTARGTDPTVDARSGQSGDTSAVAGEDTSAEKARLRRILLAARRALSPRARAERDAALTGAALRLATGTDPSLGVVGVDHGPVCAYLPLGAEPGGPGFVDTLTAAGVDVLLPVVPSGPGPLDWARHDGRLVLGPLGVHEPAGRRLGADAVADAVLVLVPALAVDRRGIRLGRGGGYYDRTLGRATGVVVAVIGVGELVEGLPTLPHDRPVAAALLPDAGLVTLGKTG